MFGLFSCQRQRESQQDCISHGGSLVLLSLGPMVCWSRMVPCSRTLSCFFNTTRSPDLDTYSTPDPDAAFSDKPPDTSSFVPKHNNNIMGPTSHPVGVEPTKTASIPRATGTTRTRIQEMHAALDLPVRLLTTGKVAQRQVNRRLRRPSLQSSIQVEPQA
ncbi:expressed unknown protein [Seminavis robusta]|uniref:Uncharacterized protein n=1 Tax=Seminavis robusta TaxID=568900 RepID=A0A9N8DGJ5_9STRA|nr:expressed unknown protein [Seminavis robusta]|eukprot:Sro77_g041870.1 n/a (160) ;mRNA; r:9840-10522